MVQSELLAQAIFASYFVIILSLFYLILNSLWQLTSKLKPKSRHFVMFIGLALGSLLHTWFYMIKFLLWSFNNFESRRPNDMTTGSVLHRMTRWLMGSDLFEQAWRRVCQGPLNWWWSEQLCIFTVGVWTAFLFVQGSQRRIPVVWAYMLLGQFVAISVASNLFFAAVILNRPTSSCERGSKPAPHKPKPALEGTSTSKQTLVPSRVYVPIFLSHLTILISPLVAGPDSRWFLPNLLIMHLLLIVPLLNLTAPPVRTRSSISTHTFYIILAALAFVPRAQTYLSLSELGFSGAGLLQGLWSTLHEHPAQSSIGYDVVWTTISFAIYCATQSGMTGGILGLVSPGLALYLADE
ncbi:hypothetical protein BDV93DRAFT_523538 [Ceratobasidium sp. AG-I]|nr:hypothetical protein BDV93DRAFT_523538 [Ceratobasidium sp. AG-I]